MQRIGSRTYAGQPDEAVMVATRVNGGGQAAAIVSGVDLGPEATFQLPSNAGEQLTWEVALTGPLGSTCVVDTRVVDEGSDGDFLICQAHNPAPVHFYTCSVVTVRAISDLESTRRAADTPRGVPRRSIRARRAAGRKASARRTGTGVTKKVAAKKPSRRKTAATTARGARRPSYGTARGKKGKQGGRS